MREKLRSQSETVLSLPKPWDSRRNRETWQVWVKYTQIHIHTHTHACANTHTYAHARTSKLQQTSQVNAIRLWFSRWVPTFPTANCSYRLWGWGIVCCNNGLIGYRRKLFCTEKEMFPILYSQCVYTIPYTTLPQVRYRTWRLIRRPWGELSQPILNLAHTHNSGW